MQILVLIGTVGQIGKYERHLQSPFDCPVLAFFFSILRPGRTAEPIFTLYRSNDVFLRKDGPFGGRRTSNQVGINRCCVDKH